MKKGHYKKVLVPKTTNNITKGIINFLNEKGHVAVRVNVQGQFKAVTPKEVTSSSYLIAYISELNKRGYTVGRWQKSGSTKGVLDINCCLSPIGRMLVIDTKNGKDKASDEQLQYAEDIIKAGGFAFFAESVEHFIEYYEKEISPCLVVWETSDINVAERCEHKNTETFRLETYCRDCGETL